MPPQDTSDSVKPPGTDSRLSVSQSEPPSPSKQPQLEIRSSGRRFAMVGLVSTFTTFVLAGGTATLILGWLFAFHDPVAAGGGIMSAVRNGSFVIKEPSSSATEESVSSQVHAETLRILTFSALASHLVSLTSTILVPLLAYRSAIQWLRSSDNPQDVNLTPIQYGLLLRTLGSGSLMSIINTLRYICRSRRATAPRLFKEALISVTGIYVLSHIVGLVDLWLHGTARAISVFRDVPVQSEAMYGLTYNETTCGPFNSTGLPCQNLISTRSGGTYWADDQPWMSFEGLDTISGTNPYLTLEYINDTAILVPGPSLNFKSQGFSINTQGLHVECTNLRDECSRSQSPFPVLAVPGSKPVTNCSKAGYPRFPYYTSGELQFSGYDTRNIQNLVLGLIGDEMGGMLNGTADFSSGWTSNPTTALVQLRWNDPRVWWEHGTPAVTYSNTMDLYGKCKMTYLDVIAQYDPIGVKWTIADTSLSRPELASILWTPMIFQLWTDDLSYAVTPYMATGPADLFDILASLMSKYGAAYTAPLMKVTAAFNVTTPQPIALGLYPVAPTLLLVGCLYIYSLTSVAIFFLSCTSNKLVIFVPRELTRRKERDKERSALDVTQSWLTDPLPLIGSVFPGNDGQQFARSTESDPLRQVYDGNSGSVKVGIGLYKGSKGETIFGLTRQSQPQTRRHDCVFPLVEEGSAAQERVSVGGDTTILPSLRGSLDDRSGVSIIPQDPSVSDQPQGLAPLSSSPEVERSCEGTGRSSPFKCPQLEIRTPGQFRVVGLASTLCVVALTGGMATLILGWLWAFQDPVENRGGILSALRNGSLAITEPSSSEEFLVFQTQTGTLRMLMFSALASHLSSVASTVLVTLLAYRAASQWLRASENPDDVNITPIQYGLLVRTLGSGSLMSIINTLRYVSRSKRAKAPRFFKEVLVSVTGIYILTHAVGLVDLWLHGGARAVSVTRSIPIETEALYGITYSDIKCGPFNRTELPCQNLVQLYHGEILFAPHDGPVRAGYDAAISDVNPYLKSEYINGTAILVPGAARTYQSRGFDFHTNGLRVQCTNLKDQCGRLATPPSQFLAQGGGPVTNCSEAGYPRIPYHTTGELSPSGLDTRNIETLVMGIIGEEMGGMNNGTEDFHSAWTPNPASIVVQIRWPNVTIRDSAEAPFVAYLNALDLYATCSLTYLDILAHYDSMESKWSILEANSSSSELASVFWTPLMFQWGGDELLHALKPYVTDRGAQAIGMLEITLAKASMALVTGLMAFIPASNVTTPRLIGLGLYPAAPILLLVTCLYIYSLAAIVIFLLACTSNKRIISVPPQLTRDGEREDERSALDVAQAWLTDPLPLIGSLFPGKDGREVARSVESDPLLQVYDSMWGLGKVGIGLHKWSTGDMIFGLMRQSHPRSRRYGRLFSAEEVEIALREKFPISGEAGIMAHCDKDSGTVPVD